MKHQLSDLSEGDKRKWLLEYGAHLREEGKAERTIESYLSDVTRFLDYHCRRVRKPLEETVRSDVLEFLDSVHTLGLKPNTFNKLVNSLSCFFAYLAEHGVVESDRILVVPKRDRVKVATGSEQEVSVLTERQVDQLLTFLQNSDRVSRRDRVIVLFLLYTGCRVSETVGVKQRALDLQTGLVMVNGKGGKLREIPLRSDLTVEIQNYLTGTRSESRFSDSEYLFMSQRSPNLNRDTVNTLLERLQRIGQFSFHLYPHIFRHTFASRLVARNVPLTTVQRLAGHASVQTTATYYVNTSRKDKQDAVNLL